jgi:hypothetical protein
MYFRVAVLKRRSGKVQIAIAQTTPCDTAGASTPRNEWAMIIPEETRDRNSLNPRVASSMKFSIVRPIRAGSPIFGLSSGSLRRHPL